MNGKTFIDGLAVTFLHTGTEQPIPVTPEARGARPGIHRRVQGRRERPSAGRLSPAARAQRGLGLPDAIHRTSGSPPS
jgi:hypothetical protein